MKSATYTLVDVEQRYGDAIPPRTFRENLPLDSIVKLIFLADPLHGERMWVQVTERLEDGRYVGELDDDAVIFDLREGACITFSPEHVLDIWSARNLAIINAVSH